MAMLLTVVGPDSPGITEQLTRILAASQVALLDVEQVVIHGQLILCFVVDLEQEKDADRAILKDLLFTAKNLGLGLDFHSVNCTKNIDSDIPTKRYAITLLGNPISAQAMYVLSSVLAKRKANIDWIRRLSECEFSSLEVLITIPHVGHVSESLKQELIVQLSGCSVDIAMQRESLTRRSKRLVVFDMDSTLIPIEFIDELAKIQGVSIEVSAITRDAMQGLLDFSESLKGRVAMLKNLDESVVNTLAEQVPLSSGAENLVRVLKGLGYKVGIISGGFSIPAECLRKRLGLDFAFANKLDVAEGKLTGKVHEPIIDAKMKAQLLVDIANRENIPLEQTIAIGDGANDALMLAKAGLGIAFHAKPALKKVADTTVSSGGLERILYLLGMSEKDVGEFLHNDVD